MFPIKSGLGSINTPTTDQINMMALSASAIHEIGAQSIIDCSILFFHQQAADVYHLTDLNIDIKTKEDGTYNLYSLEEYAEIKQNLIDTVMKYHIIDENGLANKLSPLINSIQTDTPLTDTELADPFIQKIISNVNKYRQNVFNQNTVGTIEQVIDFSELDNLQDDMILDSYDDTDDMLDVSVWEDGSVQCSCNFCEEFFQVVEKTVDYTSLNFIQNIMVKSYSNLFE